jgi:hypothetical protein
MTLFHSPFYSFPPFLIKTIFLTSLTEKFKCLVGYSKWADGKEYIPKAKKEAVTVIGTLMPRVKGVLGLGGL